MNNISDQGFLGEAPLDNFGSSLSGAGDVNGDGYQDIVASSQTNSSFTGRVYVYIGGNFISNMPYISLSGAGANNSFSVSIVNPSKGCGRC